MGKYKYLFKNIGLLTISNFGTKILSFVLIPIYTSVLSTAEYGTFDVYSTVVSLLIPILTQNITSAVMRFCLDDGYDKKIVFSIGCRRVIVSIVIFCMIVGLNYITGVLPIFRQYPGYMITLFVGTALYGLFSQYARGLEFVKDVAVAGAINTATLLGFNVLFLVAIDCGLQGYFLAHILAYIIPSIYFFIRLKVWRCISKERHLNIKEEMFNYSRPLVLNTVSWWINNMSDRYIVTWFCGVGANGIYSVAYKIPSILNIVQNIFNEAWTISAVKESEDGSHFYSNIYRVYNCGMVMVATILITMDKIIADILFANEFYLAWQYAPFLMLSVVFGSMSGVFGGVFSAFKKSDDFAKSTIIGAIVNIVFNLILVKCLGPIGAAISTLIAYIVVWAIRYRMVNSIIKLNINVVRDVCSYCVLLVQCVIWFLKFDEVWIYALQMMMMMVICVLYINDIRELKNYMLKKFRR